MTCGLKLLFKSNPACPLLAQAAISPARVNPRKIAWATSASSSMSSTRKLS